MTDAKLALFARLHAKPGKEDELQSLLAGALELARQESGTTTWFALRFDERTFGIFDTFASEEGRQAHLNGDIAAALMEKAPELLAEDPEIEQVNVLAAKVPS